MQHGAIGESLKIPQLMSVFSAEMPKTSAAAIPHEPLVSQKL
jgi:hypothetical protein